MTAQAVAILTVEQIKSLVREAVKEALESLPAASGDGEILTCAQAAKVLKMGRHRVVKLVATDGLPGRKVGNDWRFVKKEIVAWMESRQREGT